VFGVWLCVVLAALAGLVSLAFVRKAANPSLPRSAANP
jgi:hypothetical protein